ncbi:MAG: radical SAM protein [bacterium]|nr:radical SAM protein [bacterium]
MKSNSRYVVNPAYTLKVDGNRIFIFNKSTDPVNTNFIGVVHPIYAILLSLFDGAKCLDEVVTQISTLLKKDKKSAVSLVSPLIENRESVYIEYENTLFSFPENLLIEMSAGIIPGKYNTKDFLIPKNRLDIDNWRLHSPLDALFMVNTICSTNCVYCYADRNDRADCGIPLKRLKELICEAKDLGMRSFDITGGELFLYRHWEELLGQLVENGFFPYISTKSPLKQSVVRKLKNLGIDKIQVSIDSIVKDELVAILDVEENYYGKLLDTIRYLNEEGFQIYTNTQISSSNSGSIDKLMSYLVGIEGG